MNFGNLAILLYLVFYLAVYSSAQDYSREVDPKINKSTATNPDRFTRIKKDILQDISLLNPSYQSSYYAQLAEHYSDIDKVEAKRLYSISMDIALSDRVVYETTNEKIEVLTGLLVFNDFLDNEPVLGRNLLSVISKLIESEKEASRLAELSPTLAFLANELVPHDPLMAFEYAVLSLRHQKAIGIDMDARWIFEDLLSHNSELAEKYYTEVLKTIGRTRQDSKETLVAFSSFKMVFEPFSNKTLTTLQQEQYAKTLIQSVSRGFGDARSDDNLCALIGFESKDIDSYRRLSKQTAGSLMDFRTKCFESIGLKPEPKGTVPVTSSYYVALAVKAQDKNERDRLIWVAAVVAERDRDYKTAVELLDIYKGERNKDEWIIHRIQATSALIDELILAGDLVEVSRVVAASPDDLRPYIIVRARNIENFGLTDDRGRRFMVELLDEAFYAIQGSHSLTPVAGPSNRYVNPARMIDLVYKYERVREERRAVGAFSAYVDLLNKLAKHPATFEQGADYSYFAYRSVPKKLLMSYFDFIYYEVGRIEPLLMRLRVRLRLLWDLKTRSGTATNYGVMRLN